MVCFFSSSRVCLSLNIAISVRRTPRAFFFHSIPSCVFFFHCSITLATVIRLQRELKLFFIERPTKLNENVEWKNTRPIGWDGVVKSNENFYEYAQNRRAHFSRPTLITHKSNRIELDILLIHFVITRTSRRCKKKMLFPYLFFYAKFTCLHKHSACFELSFYSFPFLSNFDENFVNNF